MTREENLKKINLELEKMTDEELDQVAGGNYDQTSEDSKKLHKLGIIDDEYSMLGLQFFDWSGSKHKKVIDGWAKVGIIYDVEYEVARIYNKYTYNGKKIPQAEAWKIAEEWAKNNKK